MGFDLVIRSLEALRKHRRFHRQELDRFSSLSIDSAPCRKKRGRPLIHI
jgi:hypothetical protein